MFRLRRKRNTFHVDGQPRRSRKKLWLISVPIALIVAVIVTAGVWYTQNIRPVDLQNGTEGSQVVSIREGTTDDEISTTLEEMGLIRSAVAYRLYVRFNGLQGQMQAGGYELSPQMSVATIAKKLTTGDVAITLLTILPAQRIDQIEEVFLEAGYTQDEITTALNPENYSGHPALADLPELSGLEGYLYPETFHVTPTTPLQEVIEQSLDLTAAVLTPQLVSDLQTAHGLDVHQAVIMASIVEREVSNPEDRTKVAQVFVKRYKQNIALGSDPTALFGALLFGIEPSVFADTPYNTRLYPGLPPGPINNVSAESLRAVAYPADTDFLFFVSGDDGNTYFSNTQAEHEALAAEHCIELCRSY